MNEADCVLNGPWFSGRHEGLVMSNKTKGRLVGEIGAHRVVVRKDTKRKSTDLDRKWRWSCTCGEADYCATGTAAWASGEGHLSAATGVILHDQEMLDGT